MLGVGIYRNNNGHHVILTIVMFFSPILKYPFFSFSRVFIFQHHFSIFIFIQMFEPEELNEAYSPSESRKPLVKSLGDALKDVKASMMGVSGMGGVGKITFAKEVGGPARKDLLLEEVIFSEVRKTPDIRGIPTDLPDKLASERLKKGKKILLILDDIWKDLDLKTVGIPS